MRAVTRGTSGRAQVGPLACFVVMVLLKQEHPDWWSVEELMALTGCDEETIAAGPGGLPGGGGGGGGRPGRDSGRPQRGGRAGQRGAAGAAVDCVRALAVGGVDQVPLVRGAPA